MKDTKTAIFLQDLLTRFDLHTWTKLGKFLNIPKSRISRYINGLGEPSYKRCLQIQDQLLKHGIKVDICDIRTTE